MTEDQKAILALTAEVERLRGLAVELLAYSEWATGEFLPPNPKVFRGRRPDEVDAELRARLAATPKGGD